jgi:hypothetical protein
VAYSCAIAVLYYSLLRECWARFRAFLDSLPFAGLASRALKITIGLFCIWNLWNVFWWFNGSQTLRRLIALLMLGSVELQLIGNDPAFCLVVTALTIATSLAYKLLLVDHLLPFYFHVVNTVLDWYLWQFMGARSPEFVNSQQRRIAFTYHMAYLRLFLFCILFEAPIDVYTLTLFESLFHDLVFFHNLRCTSLCAYPFRCPTISGNVIFGEVIGAFFVRNFLNLPLYQVPGQLLGVCLLLGRHFQGSLVRSFSTKVWQGGYDYSAAEATS